MMRYSVQIETAVSRNPKYPGDADLNGITGALISERGTLMLPNYQKYVANSQRDEAFTMKQRRLWQEEQKPPTGQGGRYPATTPRVRARARRTASEAVAVVLIPPPWAHECDPWLDGEAVSARTPLYRRLRPA